MLPTPLAYLKARVPDDDPVVPLELDAGDSPLLKPLAGDLLVAYVIDRGDRFDLLQGRDLGRFGPTVDELHARAVAGLAQMSSGRITLRQAGPVQALFLDGNFEASLILLDDLWDDALTEYYQSAPVVAVPSRDILAFSEVSSAAGIQELRALIERVWPTGDHLLSRTLYVRRQSTWAPFTQ